jgi:peptidoglycan hydrolase CwlO-like protein
MELEDELRKMKTLMRGGDSDKDKIKTLLVEIDDQIQHVSETQKQNEKLQFDLAKLQSDIINMHERGAGTNKDRETEIIR